MSTDALELLRTGYDPTTGVTLGYPLCHRTRANRTVIRAVAGFDATVSAPKSLPVWWSRTDDPDLAECHDADVAAVVDYLERFGSTTRIRSNRGRLHRDSQGLIVVGFRQRARRLSTPAPARPDQVTGIEPAFSAWEIDSGSFLTCTVSNKTSSAVLFDSTSVAL